jgi:hypothetical protein
MATNRPPGDPNDPTRAGTTTTQPGVTTGTTPGTTSPNVGTVGSVGVYDQEAERHDDASLRHTSNTSTTRMDTHGSLVPLC